MSRKTVTTMAEPELPILDLPYLRQQCAGDMQLERELLRLLDGQCQLILPDLKSDDARIRSDAAHGLRGAAAGVGARRLAKTMGEVEAGREPAMAAEEVVAELRREIARILNCD